MVGLTDPGRTTLLTERLVLEPLTDAHLPLLLDLDGDAEVMRHITGRAMTPDETAAEWSERRRVDDDRFGYWAAASVGWWCLTPDDADPHAGWLGYRLLRSAWGRGYATEGCRAVLDHAFTAAGLETVYAETMAVNLASRAVMERLGMRLDRTYVGDWDDPLPGWEQGEVVLRIDRDGMTA